MIKEVGLTPAQAKQVQAVQRSTRPLMGDIFRNPQLSQEQKMAAMRQIRQQQQTQVNKILTPEQQTKYAAYQQKMRERWQARRREWEGANGSQGSGAHSQPGG